MSEKINKTEQFRIRLKADEKARLNYLSEKHGYPSVSAYVLEAAINRKIKNYEIEYKIFHAINQLLAEFSRTGNNINQIAKHLNTHRGEFPSSVLVDFKNAIKEHNSIKQVLILKLKKYENGDF